jgi:probable F420-dependent oxidoreductase
MDSMQIGIHFWAQEGSMNVAELARVTEDLGFESLWVAEHTHIPVNPSLSAGHRGPIPDSHSRMFDPWITLAVAAAVTSRIRLGTAVCLVTQHDPIVLAKEIATLDQLSGGRIDFGIGVGSVVDETLNHGVQPNDRWQVLRERTLAIKEMWTKDQAEFHGKFVNFDPIYQWPKPVQKPHPPVIVGGSGAHAINRTAEYGDGWMPFRTQAFNFLERAAELQRLAKARGRTPIPVGASGVDPDPKLIEEYQAAGIVRVVLKTLPDTRDEIMPLLKQYSPLVKQFA